MTGGPSSLLRCLHALVALLALLGGSGAHEALHELAGERAAQRPAADLEAHSSGCEHRGDAPAHHHTCVACKSGAPHAALPAGGPQAAATAAVARLPEGARSRAWPAPIPGSIGARAPPSSVG